MFEYVPATRGIATDNPTSAGAARQSEGDALRVATRA